MKNGFLSRLNCQNTNLTGADLSDVDLGEAGFHKATLIGANLSNTKLHQTGFWNSDLTGANFSGAIMDETSFDGSNLCNANLMGARPDPEYDDSNTINLCGKWEDATLCNTIMPDGTIRNDNCTDR